MHQPSLVLCEFLETNVPGVESYSPFCLKVIRGLRAAGVRYTSRREADPGAFKRYNPTGQLPILLVGEAPTQTVIADSTRILAHVETFAPRKLLDERDPALRAEALLWEELADSALSGFLVAARWADDRNWPLVCEAYFGGAPWFVKKLIAPRIRAKVVSSLVARDVWRAGADACWTRFLLTLDQLEARAPSSGHWVGSTLSIADVSIFAMLHSLRTPLTAWQSEELGKRRRLTAYLDRIDRETAQTWEKPAPRAIASA